MAIKKSIVDICREWSPRSLATFYNVIFADQGLTFPSHLWPMAYGICDTRINKLMVIIGPGSGKSLFLSVCVPAWLIGHSQNEMVLGISAGEALMQGFQKAVSAMIEFSPTWKAVFPDVKPDKQMGWSTSSGIFVSGRKPGLPDANYLACGIDSKYLTGKHGSTIIVDDLHDEENSSTADQCDKVVGKYFKTVIGRAVPGGCRFLMAGRRWHENDVYGTLKDSGDWVVLELPAEREGSEKLWYDVWVPETDFDGNKFDCVFTDRRCKLYDGTWVEI